MPIHPDFVYEGLLRFNFLPAQRRKREELPPVFNSETFTPLAADALLGMRPKTHARGFDLVEYRATKFNGVSRSYHIPHPVGYAQLADCIRRYWPDIEPFQQSSVSMIRPQQHSDGRLIIMDYESFRRRSKRVRELAFAKRYTAKTDVANCFPSLYTHAIPWAAVGLTAAKASTSGGWSNELDKFARRTVRDETQGIVVGPATSNIIAEIILGSVDKKLEGEFKFRRGSGMNGMSRFIDDYTFNCDSFDDAEKFIRRVGEELGRFKLKLNSKKTSISNEVGSFSDSWAVDLSLRVPSGMSVNAYQVVNYLEYASELAGKFPDGSVLKYAVNVLSNCNLNPEAKIALTDYVLVLSIRNPVLLPSLDRFLDEVSPYSGAILFQDRYFKIVQDGADRCRSDSMVWALYYLAKKKVAIPSDLADSVLKSNDCMAILMLYITGFHTTKIIDWISALDKADHYLLDRYWILLYQLFFDGLIGADVSSVPDSFEALKSARVTFIKPAF